MEIVNLTPHSVNFCDEEGKVFLEIKPSGTIARVSVETERVGVISLIPITQSVYGKVENLPEPKRNTVYIVSSLVAQRVPEREDVFIPNESVRDSEGRIIGCRSLGRV